MMNSRYFPLLIAAATAAVTCIASCGGDAGTPTSTPTVTTAPVPTPTPTAPAPSPSGTLTIAIISPTSETNPANDLPTAGMVVKVTDSLGTPVKDITLTWTITGGGRLVSPAPSATDSLGRSFALWALGPSAAPQTLTASHARAPKPAVFTGYVPIGTVTANVGQAKRYIGDTLSSYLTITDTKGTPLTGPARVVVRDTNVAKDLGTGTLVGAGDGSSYVVVVTGPSNTPKDSVRVDVYRTLHGTVYTYDDSPRPALRAYSKNAGVTDSADVAANGTYLLKLTSHGVSWATEVLIDAVDKNNRTFFPALMPVANHCTVRDLPNCIGSDANADISFVLVPRQYTVKRGLYAGRTLAVDLNTAMVTSVRTGPSYLFTGGQLQAPITAGGTAPRLQNTYGASEFAWLPDSLPVAVMMHRGCCSTRQIIPDDSVQLWRALSIIQTALGYQIWYPVNDRADAKTDRADSKTPNRTLVFLFDSSLPGSVSGGGGTGPIAATTSSPQNLLLQDFVVTGWRGSATDHVTVTNSMSQAQVLAMNPNDPPRLDLNVLVHEAMHGLGVGHGCQWRSTQTYCGLTVDSFPSFEDASYLALAMDVKAATWKHRALHSLTAALFGQRAIMLNLDPIPAPWTLPEPSSTGGVDAIANPRHRGAHSP